MEPQVCGHGIHGYLCMWAYTQISCTHNKPFTLFLARAVSLSELAQAPACPNCTSVVNMQAHVPIHHATTGLKSRPVLIAPHKSYSSTPPTCVCTCVCVHMHACMYVYVFESRHVCMYNNNVCTMIC